MEVSTPGRRREHFSFQNRADRVFNSALIYELPVLKKMTRLHAGEDKKGNPLYPEAQRLIHFFEPFRELSDDFVPDNSILREFIGYKKLNFRKRKLTISIKGDIMKSINSDINRWRGIMEISDVLVIGGESCGVECVSLCSKESLICDACID